MSETDPRTINLGFVGFTVDACIIDYAYTLRLSLAATDTAPNHTAEVRIESAFTFTQSGAVTSCHPAQNPVSVGPALWVIRQIITVACYNRDGGLRVCFGDDACLYVVADSDYEAWTVVDGDGSVVVSKPGGNVSVFPRRTAASSET